VFSQLPEAKYLPSGENATELTDYSWSCRVVISSRDSMLQTIAVVSLLPMAKYLPSDDNAMDELWPFRVIIKLLDSTLQTITVVSLLQVAKYLPSGKNATQYTPSLWPFSVEIIFYF
jgi:hypothetical protein